MNSKKIVIINQDSGYLMIDIANAFADARYDVVLIKGRLVQRCTPINPDARVFSIIRYRRNNTFSRLATWLIGTIQILFLVWIRFRHSRLLIVSNPPFAPLIPLVVNNPFSLLIYDIYPDALTNTGMLPGSSWPVRWWHKANRKVFGKAKKIFTLTEGMKTVLEKNAGSTPIEVVPLWVDKAYFRSVPKQINRFIKEQGLAGKFVVIYSGNLGKTHPVEILPDIAQKIKNPEVFILIIGGGEKYQMLEEKLAALNLENIRLLPLQPVDMLPYTMNAADLGVVTLEEKSSNLSIPSKTFSMIAAGLPILGIGSENSDLNKMIVRHDIGKCFRPDQIDNVCSFINEIAANKSKQEQYRQNARKSSVLYTSENAKRFINV